VKNNNLPNFSVYVPNNYNNSHDKDLDFSGDYLTTWLSKWYTPYVNTTWKDTLLMITWDEDAKDDNNHIATFFKHPCIAKGGSSNVYYDHYSIPLFVEENWDLGSLGQYDAKANNFISSLEFTCSSSGSTGPSTGKKPDPTATNSDGIANIITASKDTNMLIMLFVTLSFLALLITRLAWSYHKRKVSEENLYKLGPTFQSPLINSSTYQTAYTTYSSDYTKIPLYSAD